MSGGYFDYMFSQIEDTYKGKLEDIELNLMIDDLIVLLKELEWYKSGDTDKRDYRESVNKFKNKWFRRTDDDIRKLVHDECEKMKDELLESLGYLNEKR